MSSTTRGARGGSANWVSEIIVSSEKWGKYLVFAPFFRFHAIIASEAFVGKASSGGQEH